MFSKSFTFIRLFSVSFIFIRPSCLKTSFSATFEIELSDCTPFISTRAPLLTDTFMS